MENPAAISLAFPDYGDARWLNQRFRLAALQLEDERAIVQIIRHTLMRFSDEGLVLASTERRLPHFFQSYCETGTVYIVARDSLSSHIVGGVGIRPFAGLDPQESMGEIRELVIDRPFRGLGLGRCLLSAAIQRSRMMGYRRLYLEATSEMQHAQTLFHRCGFRPVSDAPAGDRSTHLPSYFVMES